MALMIQEIEIRVFPDKPYRLNYDNVLYYFPSSAQNKGGDGDWLAVFKLISGETLPTKTPYEEVVRQVEELRKKEQEFFAKLLTRG